MEITVNLAQFLGVAPTIPIESDVFLMVDNGILSITSFTAGMNHKIPVYMIEPGQAF